MKQVNEKRETNKLANNIKNCKFLWFFMQRMYKYRFGDLKTSMEGMVRDLIINCPFHVKLVVAWKTPVK